MKKKKKLPEYEIVEIINQIENPEKEFILKSKEIAIKVFEMRGDKEWK